MRKNTIEKLREIERKVTELRNSVDWALNDDKEKKVFEILGIDSAVNTIYAVLEETLDIFHTLNLEKDFEVGDEVMNEIGARFIVTCVDNKTYDSCVIAISNDTQSFIYNIERECPIIKTGRRFDDIKNVFHMIDASSMED